MRARAPDRQGTVDRDGVAIYYEVFGDGPTTLFMVPPAPITHSRIFKALIPYLSMQYRIVTLDGRGNGRSGRPSAADDYGRAAHVADLVAVLDETGTDQAVIIAHCHANWWAVDLIDARPERVRALVSIAPGVPYLGFVQPHWVEHEKKWNDEIEDPQGWELYNRHVITTQHRRWIEFFFRSLLIEPHSTKQLEDAVAWAMESTGEILAVAEDAEQLGVPTRDAFEAQCRRIHVPVLVIHGDEDLCQHVERGQAFAELTNAEMIVIEGAGHLALARDPVRVNLAIRSFLERTMGVPVRTQSWARGSNRRKRALYVSSPIGLGHVRRDVAIAGELRTHHPDLEIDWLAQEPVTTVLTREGEKVHPASKWLASESGHFVSEAKGHDLHCFQALRTMDEILLANFMIFQEVVEEGLYDLVICDEAWDVDHYWHENPELKRGSLVWLTDFVGYLPMPDGGEHEAFLTADYNAEMIEHVARYPRIRDRAIFVGEPDDIVPEKLGPHLPKIRDWTTSHFEFCGYITGFPHPSAEDVAEWRAEFGYRGDEEICVVAVGGSGIGSGLLQLAIAAHPIARRTIRNLRTIVVTGPRIDPAAFPQHPGLEIRGYLHRLYRHLAACDLAIVQGGLTTTMEITAAKRPFIYFPLGHHFEQNFHVRYRLGRYDAGTYMDYSATTPDRLAEAIIEKMDGVTGCRDVETDGARRAAGMIAELI